MTGNYLFVAHWEQFEVWRLNGERWELVAGFREFEVASAVALNRSTRMRLIHAVYEDNTLLEKEILMELGAPREMP